MKISWRFFIFIDFTRKIVPKILKFTTQHPQLTVFVNSHCSAQIRQQTRQPTV